MSRKIEVIASDDGSSTIFLPNMNETYHSTHGALQESEHVFIKKGLSYLAEKQEEITILEIGFGTGLNALLTQIFANQNQNIKIHYHTLEPFPLDLEVIQQLNYVECLKGSKELKNEFETLHQISWNECHQLNPNFIFTKYHTKLEDFDTLLNEVDLVYFDAFAPSRQADMWTIEQLERVAKAMKSQGILVTYCANGQFKRNLKALDFELEMLDGPPGKREMTRGIKS
ncbi:MAG: tRNA (5-methylaminomethyl-2-thiouridine)(34)-methyltransferase MnmD [Cytophagales bacterium]|nr:tRNA (5-methylaminomethyl-2-thiouridine)(34)-methyltransferase MnmD [Cytophagales bacterium]